MKKVVIVLIVVFTWVICSVSVFAQMDEFGPFEKNKVVYSKSLQNFYQSEHFEVWHSLDLRDQNQKTFFEETIAILESAYLSLSILFNHEIKDKIPIMFYKTHSEFESTNIIAEFLPEGVGAFMEHERNRMVIKADFSPPLMKSIVVHELMHSFQFSILKRGFLRVISGKFPLPTGFIEGGAEFIASLYVPHTRDDIRGINQRTDAGNPELFMPTWEKFMADQANPYAQWEMVFEFLEEKYGAGAEFKIKGLKSGGKDLGKLIEELTHGDISDPEKDPELFDRKHRDFWRDKYAEQMVKGQRPYEKEKSFEGKSITPAELPFGILSFAVSSEGDEITALSPQKNGISVMTYVLSGNTEVKIKNLTPDFPPKDFEYVVSQRGNTWPFNGSDIAWNPKSKQIAFFARYGKDHELFFVNAGRADKFIRIRVPYDQAFSPSFDPSGKKIYFSASHNVSRDIYEFDFDTLGFRNLTNDANFDTAPSVSPDGKMLAYVSFDGDFQKLFLLDLETLAKQQLTFNRHNDDSPYFLDNRTIVYTSDELNSAWNVATIDILTNEVKLWTEFFGGAFTPKFIPNSEREIAAIVFWPYDQLKNQIYKNYEIYRLKLTEPLSSYTMENKNQNMVYAWRPFNLFSTIADENQIINKINPPKRWTMSGGEASAGFGNYWGGFGYGSLKVSDIKEDNTYSAGFAFSGNVFRLIDFSYLNRERRLNWGYGFYNHKLPLRYLKWDSIKNYPNQLVFNYTLGNEYGGSVFVVYPLNKFVRVETVLNLEKRNFEIFIDKEVIRSFPEYFSDTDRQFFNFFENSQGFNTSASMSFIRDTVLYSYATQGPLHGNAARFNFEVAPPLGFKNTKGYTTLSFDYRRYKRLSDSSLLAFNVRGLRSSRAMGDYVIMGGDATLKAYPFGYLAGNQIIYGSTEIRFPFVNAIVFPGGFALGPIRSFLFADYARAKFSNPENFIGAGEKFPVQKGASLGFGFQFAGLNYVFAWRELDKFKKRVPDFYISKGWNF